MVRRIRTTSHLNTRVERFVIKKVQVRRAGAWAPLNPNRLQRLLFLTRHG